MDVKYTHVIARFFPQAQHYSIGPRYEDIIWITEPVEKSLLDAKVLDMAKNLRSEIVREESIYVRALATKLVIGTDDLLMMRTYDEKYKEAEQLLVDGDESKCNLLRQEASRTGISASDLAYAVIAQYRLSSQELNPMLGEIEAIRRNKTAEIEACVSIESLSDIEEAVWPDLTKLQAI